MLSLSRGEDVKDESIYTLIIIALIAALSLPASNTIAIPGETTIIVNTGNDDYDYTPNGTCSLREAITSATEDFAFGGCTGGVAGESTMISLSAGTYNLVLEGVDDYNLSGDLDFLEVAGGGEVITITGTSIVGIGDTSINANGIDRVIDVHPYATVILQDLTVSGGQSLLTDSHNGAGGGIYNEGHLTLQNVTISNNISGRGNGRLRAVASIMPVS